MEEEEEEKIKKGTIFKKKTIVQIKVEVEKLLVKEGLSPREILMVLRDLENDAVMALVVEQLVKKTEKNTE